MTRPIKELTINEGFNDIGTHEIEITVFEQPSGGTSSVVADIEPEGQWNLIFRMLFESGDPVPGDYKAKFTFEGIAGEADIEQNEIPGPEGYTAVHLPGRSIVTVKSEEDTTFLRLHINGPLEERAEECYLNVQETPSTYFYTLITDLVVHDNYISIKDNENNVFYKVQPDMEVVTGVDALYVTKNGKIYGHDSSGGSWDLIGTLQFSFFQFPENLDVVSDGFYSPSGTSGTRVDGELGATASDFEDYSAELTNPEPFMVNLELKIYPPGSATAVFTDTYTDLIPGTLNFTPVEVDNPTEPADGSPTLDEIEEVAGSFDTLKSFLITKGLTRINTIQKAGPIKYIDGYPSSGITDAELNKVQGHVDLFQINPDATLLENQFLIANGYANIYKIAITDRATFISTATTGVGALKLYNAARIHEVLSQNQKLLSAALASVITDYRLKDSPTPELPNSKFAREALANNINTCGCSDCKSGVSPFGYLMDLLQYGSKHIGITGTFSYDNNAPDIATFIGRMEEKFYQPFGTLNVDCETLHDEYCRVRFVTEVLEQVVADATLPGPKAAALVTARKNYLVSVYKGLLQQAGTSYDELRALVSLTLAADKLESAKKWSIKLGITLYDSPTSTNYTADRMWLIFGASVSTQELDMENIEEIFGFRATAPFTIAPTPKSLFETWQEQYLDDVWGNEDYYYGVYSREGLDPATTGTIKSTWKPIIDPDIIGKDDMTFMPLPAIDALWEHRKADTDTFLDYFVKDPGITSRISADLSQLTVRVTDRDITAQRLENDEVSIETASGVWTDFPVYGRKLFETNTDVVIEKSSAGSFVNPFGTTPKLRYKKVLSVESTVVAGITSVSLTWTDEVLQDRLTGTGTYTEFRSIGASTIVYSTASGATNTISGITFNANLKQVSFTVNNALSSPFVNGVIEFVYVVEVPLFTTKIASPELLVTDLFGAAVSPVAQSYSLLSPATSGLTNPYSYYVWTPPTWPGPINASTLFGKLKQLYTALANGTAPQAYLDIIKNNLHTDTAAFVQMMKLLINLENYVNSIFTNECPSLETQYELSSIFRKCARSIGNFIDVWVFEEIRYIPSGGTYTNTQLSLQNFWKPIVEPIAGSWDSTLQTSPTSGSVVLTDIPIIEPDLRPITDLLEGPDFEIYSDLYELRADTLVSLKTDFTANFYTYGLNAFTKLLNKVNTDSYSTAYSIAPYSSYDDLISDLLNEDIFKVKKASDVIWTAFRINKSDFEELNTLKEKHENNNSASLLTTTEIENVINILCGGYKRLQLYFNNTSYSNAWVVQERLGTFSGGGGNPLYYYKALKMKLAPGRGINAERAEWQKTLDRWNTRPIVSPDIVPPEYVKNFTTGDDVHDMWVARKIQLDILLSNYNTIFDSTFAASALFTAYKKLLNLMVAREPNITTTLALDYLPYFVNLKTRESNGENIAVRVNQMGMNIIEYRYLRKIYEILEDASTNAPTSHPLLDSEFEDVVSIFMHIYTVVHAFKYKQEEYNDRVILSPAAFVLYEPLLTLSSQLVVPVFNKWRSPFQERNEWRNILESRKDRQTAVKVRWFDVLGNVEDVNMPFLRDAIIIALAGTCETIDVAAERLAKTYFIETKDNCCVKHTRVSFAIETLQGYIFALQSGVYDTYINDSTLYAPYYKQEWEWLGTYSSWRSAMFAFLYPENLLYPTLKKLQSPAFQKLASALQSRTNLTANDACNFAKEYERYITDVENIEICCSTNADSWTNGPTKESCCDKQVKTIVSTVFYFGKGPSGSFYWSQKSYSRNSQNSTNFWYELPIPSERKDAKLLGCFSLADGYDYSTWSLTNPNLSLFYSYYEKGVLKMAYIRKSLTDPNGNWGKEIILEDLPPRIEIGKPNSYPINIVACQHDLAEVTPCFILSYKVSYGVDHIVAQLNKNTNTCELVINGNGSYVSESTVSSLPITAIRMSLVPGSSSNTNQKLYTCVCIVFNSRIKILAYNVYSTIETSISSPYPSTQVNYQPNAIIGAFESKEEDNTIVILHKSAGGSTLADRIVFEFYNGVATVNGNTYSGAIRLFQTQHPVGSSNLGPGVSQIKRLFPLFTQYRKIGAYILKIYSNQTNVGTTLTIPSAPTQTLYMGYQLALTPESVPFVPIDSADCITDFSARALQIKNIIITNTIQPFTTQATYIRTASVRECLYESYYFVPMLLAQELQQRGQFTEALAWYRSVYDYTENIAAKRKIFYGLEVESNSNNFTKASNWLLDPLNPHGLAQMRANAYTKYTVRNIIQCIYAYADRLYTLDTIETVPTARKLYNTALDLLKINELALKTNDCEKTSYACFVNGIEVDITYDYSNALYKMANALDKIGDAEIIETTSDDIVDYFNTSSDSLAEKFTYGFDTIMAATPSPVTAKTVTEVSEGTLANQSDAYRYVFALNRTNDFNATVENIFADTVAELSGIETSEVYAPASETKMEWLLNTIPANKEAYTFEFADSTGQQNFAGRGAYNPVASKNSPFQLNLAHSNANIFVAYQAGNELPYTYTPLLNYEFCMPTNPVYESLELKGNLELYKIHNCRNIAGMVRNLEVFSAPTEGASGIPVIGTNGNLTVPGTSVYTPSQYRFKVLIERAKQIVQQAQQLESLFLAAIEKEGAENYGQFQAKQGIETAKATVKLQDIRISQANSEKSLAQLQQGKSHVMIQHFQKLIDQGLTRFELDSISSLRNVEDLQYASAASYALAAARQTISVNPTELFSFLAQESSSIASAFSTRSSWMSQMASFERRNQDWEFQRDLADVDVAIGGQQVQIADDNIRVVTQEREISNLDLTNAQQTLDFLKNKFTNAELYNWMGNVLEKSYAFMLNLATSVARTAERQLYFEKQEQAGPFILDDYWEANSGGLTSGKTNLDRRGLTGSARLLVDITRLDQFAFDSNKRKLQLTKVISLSQNFPSEFRIFKETGVMNFELTNRVFDYDFPGHYLRLINSVKTTVVGLIPVYDGIKATLTTDTISYTVVGGDTFQKIPIRRLELDSVALTSANNANGLFELQPMQGELLNPFEGVGIESRWQFKMPPFSNRLDFTNIADILITVEYTALDSYLYRQQVLAKLNNTLSFNRGFSFKNDFPDQWYELGEAEAGSLQFGVDFDLKRDYFPQGIENLRLGSSNIVLYFVRESGYDTEINVLDFNLQNAVSQCGGTTVDGMLATTGLMSSLGGTNNSPLLKLRLAFDNSIPDNRDLFKDGKIRDILMIVNCKADLRPYPL